MVVADAGLLSNENIKALEEKQYQYIIGARLKNEPQKIKQKILAKSLTNGEVIIFPKANQTRLIVAYANNRAIKDEHNRKRGLQRLEKQIKASKLTKSKTKATTSI